MIITMDYNSDKIVIENEDNRSKIEFKRTSNLKDDQALIYEILNMLASESGDSIGVLLQKIDEDSQTVVEEW